MTVKVELIYPRIELSHEIVELEIKESLGQEQIIDYVFKNKKAILANSGCKLNEHEMSSALAIGAANVKIIQ